MKKGDGGRVRGSKEFRFLKVLQLWEMPLLQLPGKARMEERRVMGSREGHHLPGWLVYKGCL